VEERCASGLYQEGEIGLNQEGEMCVRLVPGRRGEGRRHLALAVHLADLGDAS
jgi:hypothetical protein